MTLTEDILFIMPRDRELQFPAMAALQSYVNCYQQKMQANTVTKEMPDFSFRYRVDMRDEDWDFFKRLGIVLNQDREEIGYPASVIELTDAKLLSFYSSEKHVCQICAAIAGVECPPFPKLQRCMPGTNGLCVRVTGLPDLEISGTALGFIPVDDSLFSDELKDGDIKCVMGVQSWRTYAAAALGLPVIDILPNGRSVNWLSKFKNPLYRLVEADHWERLPQALSSIEAALKFIEAQRQCQSSPVPADKVSEISTALGV